MKNLLGMTLAQLQQMVVQHGLPKYAAGQIARWLYQKRVGTIEEMTDLSKAAREKLSAEYQVGHIAPAEVLCSSDGTKKYAFPATCSQDSANEQRYIEAVMIPDDDRKTLCVSSQIGCRMGCRFCMTGRQGFHGNLTTTEIISQFLNVEEADSLTNTVFMGMGEPLDNWENVSRAIEILTADWGFAWSPKRITLSTVGVIPRMKEFLETTRCHLAISIHNPFPQERLALMPVENKYNIHDIVATLKNYDFTGQRRVSFEYTMFAGVNDTKRHADALARLLRGIECRVNLIRFHQIPDSPLSTSPALIMEEFQKRLNNAGIVTTIRASRGEDIFAACGMLAGQKNEKNEK